MKRMKLKAVESQHIVAGMTIVWGGSMKKVLKTGIQGNQVEWGLSDGNTQLLPSGIEVMVCNEA